VKSFSRFAPEPVSKLLWAEESRVRLKPEKGQNPNVHRDQCDQPSRETQLLMVPFHPMRTTAKHFKEHEW